MKELRKRIMKNAKTFFSENEYKRFYQTVRTLEVQNIPLNKTFHIVDTLLRYFPVFFLVQLSLFTEEDLISPSIKNRYLTKKQLAELDKIIELQSINLVHKKHEEVLLKFLFEAFINNTQLVYYFLAERYAESRVIKKASLSMQLDFARASFNIMSPLAHRMGIRPLKEDFDEIGFSLLFPEDYSELMKQKNDYFKSKKKFMNRASDQIRYYLHKSKLNDFHLQNRVKNIYSVYKKLKTKGRNDIRSLNDIFAIRIIVQTVEDCYRVFGVIHSNFSHLRGKVKDYISMPKLNSYQSLHTILQVEHENENIPVEIQIRTQHMHRVAEEGLASHFFYKTKEGKISKKYSQKEMKKQLRKMSDHVAKNTFLQKAEKDLFLRYIFIFSKNKSIFPLPKGATVLDFAFLLHTDIGKYCFGASIGGIQVPIDTTLHNGDIVEIITSKDLQIDKSWIKKARSPEVIKKIKSELSHSEAKKEFSSV